MSAPTDLRTRSLLTRVCGMIPESYVVGGTVREHLNGSSDIRDLDVAVKADGFKLASELASFSGSEATFVPLDPGRGSARLVLGKHAHVELDISSFKGESIHDDLRSRDFTINAMAVRLSQFLENRWDQLLDPLGGKSDLAGCLIRACSDQSFSDDPLRILRAHRFQADLGFTISPDTLEMMKPVVPKLTLVAGERILAELCKTLGAAESVPALKDMDRVGVIDVLFPELAPMRGCLQNEYHHLDVWDHTVETVRSVELVLGADSEAFGALAAHIDEYAEDEPVKGRSRKGLIKLAAIFHDAGKPHCRTVDSDGRVRFFGHEKKSAQIFTEVGDRIKLSNKEISMISDWIIGHMRPMIFTREQPVSRRTLYRLNRDYGPDMVGLLVLFLADLAATRGPARTAGEGDRARVQACRALEFSLESAKAPPVRLLNGRNLMSLFGLEPGPFLGRMLSRLDELQGVGEIANREQAVEAAERFLEQDAGRAPQEQR